MLVLGCILIVWVVDDYMNRRAKRSPLEDKKIVQCAICMYTYIVDIDEKMSRCPAC